MAVNPFYLGAFVLYLVAVLAIGIWGYTRTSTIDDFMVYGKQLGPWLATWSLVANFISAVAVIGMIGVITQIGYAVVLGVDLGLMLGMAGLYFVAPRIRQLDEVTLSDIVADITGREWSRPVTGTILLGNAWVYTIMQLVGASFLVTTITGVPYEYMVWVIGGVFIIYTVTGGLVSVAWTDLVQGILMVVLVTVTFAYLTVDLGGLAAVSRQFAAMDPANVTPLGSGAYTVIGVVSSIVAFFGTIFTGQNIIIRINATRDIQTTRFHIAAAGVILSVFLCVLAVLGAQTAVALQNAGIQVSVQDRAFPTLIMEYLPNLIGSVVIIGIMSAILSTTDTRLHAVGVTMTRDIYDYFNADTSDEHRLKVSRLSTGAFGVLATIIAMNPPGTIFTLYEFRAVLLTTGLLIPTYVGLYDSDLDGRAVVLSMALGAATGIAGQLVGGYGSIPATIAGVVVAFVALYGGDTITTRLGSPTTN